MVKYGRWGKPHLRRFWVENGGLHWESPKKSSDESTVVLNTVTAVKLGRKTSNFARHRQKGDEHNDHLAMSIMYGDKSLDILFRNKQDLEIWVEALTRLTGKTPA
jgi:hypothetical protein